MSDPDAVVIGAGHNGLVAANHLADAGWDVVVCEATPHVGGAVQTADVTAPGYHSDLFSAFYPLAAASPVIEALQLGRYGLDWAHAPAVLGHVFPDDRSVVLSRDLEATAASVDRFAAGDGAAWRRLVGQYRSVEADLLTAVLAPFPPVRAGLGLARTLGPADGIRFLRQAVLPVRRFGEELFEGAGAPMLFAGNALHADLSPDAAGSGVFGYLLTMLAQTVGFPVPVGGAGRLTQAMADRLVAAGGEIRTGAPVVDVLVESGTAVGVRLASGESIRARRAVLADVAAPILYGHLVDRHHLPARLLEDMTRFQWDTPTLKIDWALSEPVPWTAREVAGAATVHLGVDMNGLSQYATDLVSGRVPQDPFVLFGQMTTSDPSRSPDGTESAWAYTHLPPGPPLSDADVARQVARVEARLERHAPGFADLVVGRHVQPPHGLQRRNPNLVDGAINGGTAQIHQQLFFRPVPGLGGAATPIDRLLLAGSSAHPGGGVHGAAGANAARAARRRDGVLGPVRHRIAAGVLRQLYKPAKQDV